MITTGIIKELNLNAEGYIGNVCLVELPIFNSTTNSASYKSEFLATISLPGGINDDYHVGDLVYVGFINNKYSYPVILGKIYKGIDDRNSGSYKVTSLNVSDKTELSKDTKIGDITYNDLLEMKTNIDILLNTVNDLNTILETIISGTGV